MYTFVVALVWHAFEECVVPPLHRYSSAARQKMRCTWYRSAAQQLLRALPIMSHCHPHLQQQTYSGWVVSLAFVPIYLSSTTTVRLVLSARTTGAVAINSATYQYYSSMCVLEKKSSTSFIGRHWELTLMLAIGRPVSSNTTSPHWHLLMRVVGSDIAAPVVGTRAQPTTKGWCLVLDDPGCYPGRGI